MEEDDEFGDLYTDVLRPFASQTSSAAPVHTVNPDPVGPRRDAVLPPSKTLALSLNPIRMEQSGESALPQSRASGPKLDDRSRGGADGSSKGSTLLRFDIEENVFEDEQPGIPGVSDGKDSGRAGGDWDSDSDSDDDLQIVLNDSNNNGNIHGGYGRGGVRDGDDDDEDGDPLVIVADDGDAHQVLGEQEWGDNTLDTGNDQKKEVDGKANGGMGGGTVPGSAADGKVGFSAMGYHPFHSQFKYVRPGASPMPGSNSSAPVGAPGQVRPPLNIGSGPGRGRGDWRLSGMKNASGLQKGFHSGFGMPAWSSGRGQGGGLEFSLPSHKTIFEVDIDHFEEKPWRYQSVDITDFFNFGLNEESWKDYCKQLEQRRMETTMQSKIHVYESGRTEKDFDPDMPPELAAATGVHENLIDNATIEKSDAGQIGLKASIRMRPALPTGRPIQVETGFVDRLPSIDTRPPRIRDADAIIEIVCQDSADDNSSASGAPECTDTEPTTTDLGGQHIVENSAADEDRGNIPVSPGGQKRETDERSTTMKFSQRETYEGEEDSYLVHGGSPQQRPPSRKLMQDANDSIGERLVQDDSLQQSPSRSEENIESLQERAKPKNEIVDSDGAEIELLMERNHALENKPSAADRSSGLETEEVTSDSQKAIGKSKTGKEKPDSTAIQELEGVGDAGAARSSENSKARSSSRETYKWRDGADDEVVQGDLSTRRVARGIPEDNEPDSRRRDHSRRQEREGSNVSMKAMVDPHRDWDSGSVHSLPIERRKDRDHPDVSRRRQEDEFDSERIRGEDSRKRDRSDELGPKDRSRVRENERDKKEDYLPSKRPLDNGIYKSNYEKEAVTRRERDESLRSRYDNMDDHRSKRKRVEEFVRREFDTEEFLRESSSRQKREKDTFIDLRQREEHRGRERMEDPHSSRLKDGDSVQRGKNDQSRDREERHKARQNHEGSRGKREREEDRAGSRIGRVAEEKSRSGQERTRDDHKASEKEYQHKETARPREQVRKREQNEEKHLPHQDNIYARSRQLPGEDRRSQHEKSKNRDRSQDNLTNNRKLHESHKKNKDSQSDDPYSSRRTQEDRTDKTNNTGSRGPSKLGSKDPTDSEQIPSSRADKEAGSSEDEQSDSRRGRSKLEQWTSHNERDNDPRPSSSSRFKDTEKNVKHTAQEANKLQDPAKASEAAEQLLLSTEGKDVVDVEKKDIPAKPLDNAKHLDTVEKLKKRSERFKLPMPSEKEAQSVKKIENEPLPTSKTETVVDSEVKPERPARKRRWVNN
ncbi:hypothetical protein MLD38_005648 [Melastoma candidum]|uniref:Uncharacterized protein n=1 Tax=Melastoma candidum TaxID=119954 RepID=A0ACB9RKC5_9MYRT|nr:hypothetical protein MLD38_005648 [Melastoma candidum]